MRLLEVGARVSVEVSATSANLGPGFDCFGLALDWRERVDVEVTASGVSVDVTGEGSEVLPRDETHLVVRCLTEGLDGLGARAPGLALRGHNTIPHGRGLGSSSAAIVAGLVAARALAGADEDRGWLLRHANRIEGHPDNVAAAIHGGFVMAYGHGEHVEVVRGRVHPDVRAAVVVPERPVETKAARRLLPDVVPHADAAADAGRAALLVHALAEDPRLLHAGTQDWLHQRYREPAMPEAYALVTRLRALGLAATISGAGPSVLVLGTEADLARLEAEEPGTRSRRLGIGGAARVL
ncbi:homoserine kinase [Microlunatus sagamiharensis]|uniref:Homoserine kinase n=1 Tax=Microlunatus sagamiharensis TaxID=546874 RepID=A0A1H2M9M9_9ACTN|nr:homoserine kinase [Microlunatus sagamiharensis]SDU89947.1 homoserine kinase [Microlunatus sagamiharensis]